eukprot:COSAG01_NODE_320_length_18904_cov_45.662537_20_plen_108_part_00
MTQTHTHTERERERERETERRRDFEKSHQSSGSGGALYESCVAAPTIGSNGFRAHMCRRTPAQNLAGGEGVEGKGAPESVARVKGLKYSATGVSRQPRLYPNTQHFH